MAEDFELPVWGIRPNWADPVLETLEWSSDVLTSGSGAEQRFGFRLAPRRLIEARYNPFDNERTFADLALHRLGRGEWMMPLFFDTAKLTSSAAAGAERLDFATEYHEFSAGGMAYLVGPDCFSGEAVRIAAVDSDGIDLVVPLDAAWASGSTIHPMRRGRFESPNGRLITSRVSELRARFEIIAGNELSSEGDWATSYSDIPVLTARSEWSEPLDFDLSWLSEEFDSQSGLKYVTDDAGRTFRQQRHAFILHGAQEQFEFRQMLYRLRGRQRPLWVPSAGDDFTVAADAAALAEQIDVQTVGLTYVGGPVDGRDHVRLPDGQIIKLSSAAIVSSSVERLALESAATGALSVGDRFEFIETCRLAADSVEIEHLGDTDGVARTSLAFVAFPNRRSATEATQEIPIAEMSDWPCDGTTPPDNEGWDHEWTFQVIDEVGDAPSLSVYAIDYPGEGGYYHGASSVGGDIFSRTITNPSGQDWRAVWKMNRSFPDGDYIVNWDPSNFPGTQHYNVYYRHWTMTDPVLVDTHTTSGMGAFSRTIPFLGGEPV